MTIQKKKEDLTYHAITVGLHKMNKCLRLRILFVLKVNRFNVGILWYITLIKCDVGRKASQKDPSD